MKMTDQPGGRGARRSARLLGTAALVVLLAGLPLACNRGHAEGGSGLRVIVLGFDGMDYDLTREMLAQGQLPNLARLAKMGTFGPLGTALPPQSPVAWSNFITGMDAGGHGIYDFIQRDPETMIPYLSTSRTEAPERNLKIGKYQFPLSSAKVELLRHGKSFWGVLEKHGVRTTIVRIPANFPPSGTASYELSGMGTPDILGTYGIYSYFTSDATAFADKKKPTSGKIYHVQPADGVVRGTLYGPANPFLVNGDKVTMDFTVYIDPEEPVAKIVVGDEERILKVGEWSDWVPFAFHLIPTQSLHVICRFYLKQVRPQFELYVTPLNLDPIHPAMPISTPFSWARDLAEATGDFYTQGMPEDTKALEEGVFSPQDFVTQAHIAGEEVIHQYGYVLDHFNDGLLFYYFGNSDQVAHMMWRPMDPGHPAYVEATDAPFKNVVRNVYEGLDAVVGTTLDKMGPDTLLIVMSDHGFTSWRRAFHLNAWLKENGYLTVLNPFLKEDPGMFENVDWSRTRAYGLGLNGLYINLRGREKYGIVDPAQRAQLVDEIAKKLEAAIDPATGKPAVDKAYKREEAYKDRGELDIGPDIVVGYAKGTRCSNQSALGGVGTEVFTNNTDWWSGDHCMDPAVIPGVLFTSRPLKKPAPRLQDLAAAILAEFGVEQFPPRE
jgi:predicted AlkP superfamily phosphohydrolase/phosphomutase